MMLGNQSTEELNREKFLKLGEKKMEFSELINQNISKKWGLAIAGMALLWQTGAPSWQIAGVAAIAIVVQGVLDIVQLFKGEKQ